MGTYENDVLMSYKDENGNLQLLYPITKVANIADLTKEAIGVNYTNPNLLDNWYFGNPVNQRGQTEYTSSGYTIDRWTRSTVANAVVRITDNGFELDNTSGSSTLYVRQYFETEISASKFTISALVKEVSGSPTIYVGYADSTFSTTVILNVGCPQLAIVPTQKIKRVQLAIPAGARVVLGAVKLELGDAQTLAHQDTDGNWVLNEIPNYADQLARCQRQLLIINSEGNNYVMVGGNDCINVGYVYVRIPIPTTLRTNPALSYEGTWNLRNGTTSQAVTGMEFYKRVENGIILKVLTTGLTVGAYYTFLNLNDTTARLIFSAEL